MTGKPRDPVKGRESGDKAVHTPCPLLPRPYAVVRPFDRISEVQSPSSIFLLLTARLADSPGICREKSEKPWSPISLRAESCSLGRSPSPSPCAISVFHLHLVAERRVVPTVRNATLPYLIMVLLMSLDNESDRLLGTDEPKTPLPLLVKLLDDTSYPQ